MCPRSVRLALFCACALAAPRAHAEALELGGRVQSDIRARPRALTSGAWYDARTLPRGIARNQSIVKLRLRGEIDRVAAVADVDFLWLGNATGVRSLTDLTRRDVVDPYRLRTHAAYVEVHDLWAPGLDLRVGQQVVNWGKGDQFNPTNNLNANTFEDPLLFGQQQANSMLRLDYAPTEALALAAVVVPLFQPAILPESAAMALGDLRRMPMREAALRRRLLFEQNQALTMLQTPTVVAQVTPRMPGVAFDNVQGAVRAAFSVGTHDMALSYYVGRSDMPQPVANDTEQVVGQRCRPGSSNDCIAGTLQTHVSLAYPRMQVLGLNLAGELPLPALLHPHLAPFGYHLELATVFPEATALHLTTGSLFNGLQPAGELAYGLGGRAPQVVGPAPFVKWNLGLDYTLPGGVYLNLQWVHGFVDEFGTGEASVRGVPVAGDCLKPDQCIQETLRPRLGDYLVLGTDVRWFNDALLTRLFIIYDVSGGTQEAWDPRRRRRVRSPRPALSPAVASAVLFPEITYNAGAGVELSLGALAKLGRDDSKFGDPAAGGTEVWARGSYSF